MMKKKKESKDHLSIGVVGACSNESCDFPAELFCEDCKKLYCTSHSEFYHRKGTREKHTKVPIAVCEGDRCEQRRNSDRAAFLAVLECTQCMINFCYTCFQSECSGDGHPSRLLLLGKVASKGQGKDANPVPHLDPGVSEKKFDAKPTAPETDQFVVQFNQVRFGHILGHGAFGKVFQAVYRGADVAVKRLPSSTSQNIKQFEREMELTAKLPPHPNSVKVIGIIPPPNRGIVMELYPLLSVEEFVLKKKAPLSFRQLLQIAIDSSAGLINLHEQGIVHRDVAARNFLLKSDCAAAICDFGLGVRLPAGKDAAEMSMDQRVQERLPLNISAPEQLNAGVFSKKSDVYMFGLYLWELFERRPPFIDDPDLHACLCSVSTRTQQKPTNTNESMNSDDQRLYDAASIACSDNLSGTGLKDPFSSDALLYRTCRPGSRWVSKLALGYRPPLREEWPRELRDVIKACWESSPNERPCMLDVNLSLRKILQIAQDIPFFFSSGEGCKQQPSAVALIEEQKRQAAAEAAAAERQQLQQRAEEQAQETERLKQQLAQLQIQHLSSNSSRQGKESRNTQVINTWECLRCTFKNHELLEACEMCGSGCGFGMSTFTTTTTTTAVATSSQNTGSSDLLKEKEEKLEDSRQCVVCLEVFPLQSGIECTGKKPHFLCDDCFAVYVNYESTDLTTAMVKRNGKIICPLQKSNASDCDSHPFADEKVARRVSDKLLKVYLDANKVVMEAALVKEMEQRKRLEMVRLASMDNRDLKIEAAFWHICEKILTLSCPRCHKAFLDYCNGCLVLQCSACPCKFCGWCLTDCGEDAHQHVANCSLNPTPDHSVFASEKQWKASQRERRKALVLTYLDGLGDIRSAVVARCQEEFRTLGLQIS